VVHILLLIFFLLRLFQNFSFGTATLKLAVLQGGKPEKLQEPVSKPCALAHSQFVLEQALLSGDLV
jgi:hypothetical protein